MLRALLRIAALETRLQLRVANREVFLVILVGGLLIGLLAPTLQERGVHPDAGLFVVEATPGSPLLPAIESNLKFTLHVVDDPQLRPSVDLAVRSEQVAFKDSEKSRAAARELELTVERWLDEALLNEADPSAAYPVRVNLVYESRPSVNAPPPTPAPTAGATTSAAATTQPTPGLLRPDVIGTAGEQQLGIRPNQVEPPFPLRGLLLTFAYVVPLTFLTQLYAGGLLEERTRQRGLLLLSTPHPAPLVLAGRSLPYALVAVGAGVTVTILIRSDWLGLLAAAPILLFALSTALLFGVLARSPRELTFLLVSSTVLLNTFLFLPPIFGPIPSIAFLSPVSVILSTLRAEPVSLSLFLYATLPLTLIALVFLSLGVALYREETLFAPRGLLTKVADALGRLAPRGGRLLLAGTLAVPVAFALELFLLLLAVSLNLRAALVAFLLGGAFIEEGLKGLLAYAHVTRARRPVRTPWATGALIGGGFFLGEKGALALVLLGFSRLPLSGESLAAFGIAASPLLVLAPLLLHATGATVTAYGARRGRGATALAWCFASLLHASYNLLILWIGLQGGL